MALTNEEAKRLRMIETAEQLPEAACYYANTATRFGKYGATYTRLFDKDFNEIENVIVRYTNALDGLIHVSDESDSRDYHTAQMVYHLHDRNELGFWLVTSIDYR